MVETFIGGGGGGGGGVQLFIIIIIIFFFFFWGGGGLGGGMQILISIETYITEISNCPLPCHGLSFLKVSEGLPAGAVGNMSDYCCFFFFGDWGGGGGGANAYFQRNLKNL